MFTGLISAIGVVLDARDEAKGKVLRVATSYALEALGLGASIACSGICLTVVAAGADDRTWFEVQLSPETLRTTTAGFWRAGRSINLETSLSCGDTMGGHFVTGHVDGVASIYACEEQGDYRRFEIEAPAGLARFIAPKGSVALDGTSLTVNEVRGNRFSIMLIPHTLLQTTWGNCVAGDAVNIEVDLLARYAARLLRAD